MGCGTHVEAPARPKPFAFALITPDGADSAMVHAVDAGSIDKMSTGMRVTPRLRGRRRTTDRRPRMLGARMTDVSRRPKENLVMKHLVSLTYAEELTPILERFVDALIDGRIVGHKCPQCGRVYVPGKGYCPLCVVPTAREGRGRGRRHRHGHGLHDHHAGRVLRPDGDRAVRVRVGAARRRERQPRRPGHRRRPARPSATRGCA